MENGFGDKLKIGNEVKEPTEQISSKENREGEGNKDVSQEKQSQERKNKEQEQWQRDNQKQSEPNQENKSKEKHGEGHKEKQEMTERVSSTFNGMLTIAGWGIVIIGLYIILNNLPIFSAGVIDPKTGLIVIFLTGVLTSLHCIGMCSGFVVSYASTTNARDPIPHLCYNGSRILSYVMLGALLGLVGSVFSFNNQIRSYLAIFAGLFMIVFGLSMFFPKLRRFVTLPGINLHSNTDGKSGKKGPIFIGLLNGLMPCGPLQAMLIYAAGTGSIIEGALTMLAFGLGTVPLMLVFGSIASVAASSKLLINKIVKFSGVLVFVLGLIMLNRGFSLVGIDALSIPFISGNTLYAATLSGTSINATIGNLVQSDNKSYQEIIMYVDKYGWDSNVLTVKKGIPVRWTIIVKELTYCNKGIKVPKLGIDKIFEKVGDNVTYEFTPTEIGTIYFTCWMGMLPGRIEIVEDSNSKNLLQGSQQQISPGNALINIRGMCCQGCANKIQKTLAGINGVKTATVSFQKGEAEVSFDPKVVSTDTLVSSINKLGYKATLIGGG